VARNCLFRPISAAIRNSLNLSVPIRVNAGVESERHSPATSGQALSEGWLEKLNNYTRETTKGYRPGGHVMFDFCWGMFWAVLGALFVQGVYRLIKRAIVGYISKRPDASLWDIYLRLI
jgi:hypothetical protein